MAIPREVVEEIKSRADIVDIISSYINLSKKGRNYWGVCPFHNDSHPSLSVSPEKRIFSCFACGASGDVFSFVSKIENIYYTEAVKKVAELVGYDDPRLHSKTFEVKVDESKATLYRCITELNKLYNLSLLTEEGEIGMNYLRKRGITDEQIQRFSLGYSPKDGQIPIKYLTQKKFTLKNIQDIGISLVRTEGMRDSNAGRLIFPIKNGSGQVVGFSARRLDDTLDTAKYVNSPDTEIFIKGNYLYNYDNARQTMKQDGFLYVVEGFLDAFAIDKIGVHSVVALMGTALSEKNLETLRRSNVEIRFCLDNDTAGQKAMMKFIPELNKAGISYRFVSMPEEKYKDSDEILHNEGEENLRKYINSLVDSFEFALNYYENISPLETTDSKLKVINHFAPLLLSIKDKYVYEDRVSKLAKVTGFEVSTIKTAVQDYRKKESKKEEVVDYNKVRLFDKEDRRTMSRLQKAELLVLTGMLSEKQAARFYVDNVKYFITEIYRIIANYIIEHLETHDDIDQSDIITAIECSDMENKEQLIREIVMASNHKKDKKEDNELEELNDAYQVIIEEREKIHSKEMLIKSQEGKTLDEKARLLDEYIKRTNEDDIDEDK